MPFTPTTLFAVAHNAAGTRRLLFTQQNDPVAEFAPAASSGALWQVTGAVLRDAGGAQLFLSTLHSAFSFGAVAIGATATAPLVFDRGGFEAFGNATAKNNLVDAWAGGGRIELNVVIDADAPTPSAPVVLAVELRALLTADFLVNAAGVAQPAHHTGVAGNNLSLPSGEALGSYEFSAADLGGGPLTVAASGAMTIAAASAPTDAATRNLQLTIHDTVRNTDAILPIDLHVPTDCVILIDKSGSMGTSIPAGPTKWEAARDVANLFAQLYTSLVEDLSAPNGSILAQNNIALGRFSWDFFGGGDQTSIDALQAANLPPPSIPVAETPGGSTPIGPALVAAHAAFGAGSPWRKRHVVMLSDGMHNAGSPHLSAIHPGTLPNEATNATTGIALHNVSYAITGETPVVDLQALATVYAGQFHDSGADTAPLSSHSLRAMFLSVLADILPVERAETMAPTEIPVEDGIERALFVATGTGAPLTLSHAGQTTQPSASGFGFTWAEVRSPEPGAWTIDSQPAGAQVFALFDLALRMRAGVINRGLGQPLTLWAEITQRGQPVAGADVRVAVSRPGESLGALLTAFAQGGALRRALRRGYLSSSVLTRPQAPLLANVDALAVISPTAGTAVPDRHAGDDARSIRGVLLEALERDRNLAFQFQRGSFLLKEVRPGRYEADLPAALTRVEGTYTFALRADGETPAGHRFARDHRLSTVLEAVPEPKLTEYSVAPHPTAGGALVVTVLPRSAIGSSLGPGLAHNFALQVADQREPLAVIDNADGTYGATVKGRADEPPKLAFVYRTAGRDHEVAAVPLHEPQRNMRRVKVTLERVRILDDKDPCIFGKGELSFDAVVAPNGNPNRAARTRIPERGHVRIGSGQTAELEAVIYDGFLEQGASLDITLGATEFDWLLFFTRREQLARYHRLVILREGTARYAPGDELRDPERLHDWELWYRVEVG